MDDDSFGRTNMGPDPLDPRDDWNPSGDSRTDNDPLRNDPPRSNPINNPRGNDDLDGGRSNLGLDEFERARDFRGQKPPLEDGALGTGTNPMDEPIDRSVRKPPISAPVGEEPAPADSDRDPSDVLPKADDSDAQTTSLHEGRSFVRLAGYSSNRQQTATSRVSSSRSKQRAPRWISLPAPAGRIRL